VRHRRFSSRGSGTTAALVKNASFIKVAHISARMVQNFFFRSSRRIIAGLAAKLVRHNFFLLPFNNF
jgi:hypothetical protein